MACVRDNLPVSFSTAGDELRLNSFLCRCRKLGYSEGSMTFEDVCAEADEQLFTACTVVQAVVKVTSQSNGKGQILTPRGSETPERI